VDGALLARCRFPEAGTAVVCAVSGGADSLALLALASEAGCHVTAVHVDHGLRPDSAAESRAVAVAAQRFGARFESRSVRVEPGANLEARARAARYGALPRDVLLGHTADDQAETMLLNLLRGSGLDGLSAMRAGDPRRPLLALRRAETRALCDALGLEPFVDPSNDDSSFRRNRVWAELLPLLDDIAERDVVPVLTRQAGLLGEVADLVRQQAADLDPIDASAIAAATPALARVAIRDWLRPAAGERHPPDAATVDRVLAVARGDTRATEVGGGRRVARTAGRLRLECD
jgi:tRNA(Ile)-lysidine synthase